MNFTRLSKAFMVTTSLVFTMGAYAQGTETVLRNNYSPNGEKWVDQVAIDWNAQKVYVKADLSSCTQTNEGILSVGSAISAWNGEHWHLYYTKSSSTLQVNYLSASNGNVIRTDVNGISGTVEIEISKALGLTVNGKAYNIHSGNTVDVTTACAALWGMPTIEIGSQEGNTRSYATYEKICIQPVGDTPTPPTPDPGPYSPTATDQVYDGSGWSDEKLLKLFKEAFDNGRTFPTDAAFEQAGIQKSDIAFVRSHVPNPGIQSRSERLLSNTYENRNLWMNIPMDVGKDFSSGMPNGSFASDNFSMWNYTNIFGSWNRGLFTAPAAWTDAAHKNGTDIMSGMKFFDTTGGGTGYASGWMKFITEKDADGNFVYAEPMINLLMYFGFDGINYNWEDSGYGNDDIVAFHKQLYKIAARKGFDNFHCGIYTSVSQLNAASPENTNALFGNSEGRTHDLMLNYSNGDFAYSLGRTSKAAQAAMGTTDGLYAGVWIVSMDRRWNSLNSDDDAKKVGICLWGEHNESRFWSYNSGADAYTKMNNYQRLLERAFSGGNRNPLIRPEISNSGNNWEGENPLSTFAGLATWIPERTTITGNLPFATGFNLGNGDRYSYKGKRTTGSWYNMASQDIVPTYRWLVVKPGTKTASQDIQPEFTTEDQYTGGTALQLTGKATADGTDIVLYKTDLNVSAANPYAKVAVKNGKNATNPSNLYVIVQKGDGSWVETAYGNVEGNTWQEKKIVIGGLAQGDVVKAIGLRVKGSDDNYKLLVGKLEINDDVKATPAAVTDLNVEIKQETKTSLTAKLWWNTTATATKRADWDLAYNKEGNIDHFEILYKNGEDGKVSEVGRTTTWGTLVPNIEFESEADRPFIGVRSVSTDLKTYSAPVWVELARAEQDKLPAKKDLSYGVSEINPNAEGVDIARKIRFVTKVTTTGADQNIDYSATTAPADGTQYVDATDHMLTINQGQTVKLFIKCYDTSDLVAPDGTALASPDGLRYCFGGGWLDLNGNKMFEPTDVVSDPKNGERLFTVGTLRKGTPEFETQGITTTFVVPEDAKPGPSRLRIVFTDAWFAGTFLPTGYTAKGFSIDFGVTIKGTNPGRESVDNHDKGIADEPEDLNGTPTGIHTATTGQVSSVSVEDGKINFQNVDKAWIYTLSGAMVSYHVNPTMVAASLPQGVYLVKMQSGSLFRSQKIVIE